MSDTATFDWTPAPRAPFRPAMPERPEDWLPVWRIFVDKEAQNALNGWPKQAFDDHYKARKVLTLNYHFISDPAAIQHVLMDKLGNYQKPPLVNKMLSVALGQGLLTTDGEAWREQRRMMAPVFTPHMVTEFTPTFVRVAEQTADRWATGDSDVIDVAAESLRTTFDIINATLFSSAAGFTAQEASGHMAAVMKALTQYRLGPIIGMPWLDQNPVQWRGAAGRRFIIDRLAAFIARRQADPAPPQDFMTRVIDAFSATHPPKEAARLALDNAVTFLGAGHETTANALTWALYLLSRDRQAQEWAGEEARAAWDAGGTPEEVLTRLPYLKMVWEETLRLYPPAVRIDREALVDDELCGHRVRKGDQISIWPWIVHRHRRLWNDPDAFNPENFHPEAKAAHHRFQYIPFGAGPRVCIGAAFAQAEGLLVLSHWLARFRFRPVAGHTVEPTGDIAIRPKGGLPLIVERV
ncbi:MAG: cytochrome P450 [Phenylobacterium sp.]|uniref:cytochrome P450 n=1 Tax=Phenylobacterium sp. TaxID=1871053 RepID=UPI002731CD39|nr:cytochrome P450 [Phenylobacterium sp.]MDP2009030.1 cytochrome P450 [Phenylobacterium sp.]